MAAISSLNLVYLIRIQVIISFYSVHINSKVVLHINSKICHINSKILYINSKGLYINSKILLIEFGLLFYLDDNYC